LAGRDITDGGGTYDLSNDIGIVSSNALWSNTDVAYDTAIGGLPFIYAINDARPYLRQTAPFRKDQFDNGSEPGEQSLSGWWLRSQSSFHSGAGINFFDPLTNDENGHYRFHDSKGVNVWDKGQAKLLKSCSTTHFTTGAVQSNGRAFQQLRSIKWGSTSGVLLWDEYDVDKIAVDGTLTHFVDYTSGTDSPVYAICDDGTYAYWITNTATKKTVYKKPLTGSSASTADVVKVIDEAGTISNATMEYVKDRLVICANNKVYESPTSPSNTTWPSPVYTHPASTHVYTSVAASGPAIYVAGYNGIQSTIGKFTLGSNGTMPTLSAAVVAAELPVGEIVHKIYYYLGLMMIGTNKGIRIADVLDDGSIKYGALIVETSQPCYDFAARDRFVWCATSVDGEPGVIRIDLGHEIEPLVYAYANDLYYPGVTDHVTTSCAFADGTDRLVFTTAYNATNGGIYIENESTLLATGYLTTGKVRYSTLEPKNFKRLLARGNFNAGSFTLQTVTKDGANYDHITYESGVSPVEVGTTQPETPQEYVSFKFIFNRDETVTSTGPIFEGWQCKATIATPRQRVLQFPVFCYDVETDRYNAVVGYEGRADDRLRALEAIEENGDVVVWQDLTTGESRQCVIEQVTYSRMTPPDKRFDGQGGVIEIRIRTV
jgi:hypothetical protein